MKRFHICSSEARGAARTTGGKRHEHDEGAREAARRDGDRQRLADSAGSGGRGGYGRLVLHCRTSEGAGCGAGRHSSVTVHESAYVEEPCEIGAGARIWQFSHVMPDCRIGRDCVIGQNVMIGPGIIVGDRCKIQNDVSLHGRDAGGRRLLQPLLRLHQRQQPARRVRAQERVPADDGAPGPTIGPNATIVCGHEIGAHAFIGAGAVVIRAVPAYTLLAGVPARRIGWISRAGGQLGDDLVCPPRRQPLPAERGRRTVGGRWVKSLTHRQDSPEGPSTSSSPTATG